MYDYKEILQKIIMGHLSESDNLYPIQVCDKIIEDILSVRLIRRDINDNEICREESEQKYKVESEQYVAIKKGVQNRCKHWKTTYFPDAAGGSDSFTECDICGKQL